MQQNMLKLNKSVQIELANGKKYKKEKLEEGVLVFSPVTEIYYKLVNGEVMKYPTYAKADKIWKVAGYKGSFKGMLVSRVKNLK